MSKKFKFINKVEPIEICGKEYTLDTGNIEWLDKVMKTHEETSKKIDSIQGLDWGKEDINQLVEVMAISIDTMLGEGEFEYIFNHEECKRNIRFITSLCNYLLEEIKSQTGK